MKFIKQKITLNIILKKYVFPSRGSILSFGEKLDLEQEHFGEQ